MRKVIKIPDMEKKPPSNKGIIIFLILLALVLIIGIVFVVKTLIPTSGRQTTIEETAKNVTIDEKAMTAISLNSLSDNSFAAYNDGFINVTDDLITFYKSSGEVDTSVALNLADPIYSTDGRYVALASRGGKDIKILKDKKNQDQITTDQDINNIAINARGDFAIVMDDDYYKSRVSLRNNKGEEIFSWLSANGYVVKCDISSDGKKLYLTTLNSGDEYYTEILCFSIYEDKPIYQKKFKGQILAGGTLLNNNNYLAVFGNQYVTLNDKGEVQKKYTYPATYSLKTYDLDSSGHLALAFSSSGETHIVMASTTGFSGEPTDTKISGTISAIGLKDTNVLAAATNKIYLIGFNGSTKKTISLDEYGISKLLCYSSQKVLAIRSTSASVLPY